MFCVKCGTQNQDGALFCEKCGAKIVQRSQITQGKVPGNNQGNHQRGNPKKKNKRGVLIIAAIVILIAAVAAAVLIAMQKKKEKDYTSKLDKAEKYIEELDYEKAEAAYLAAIDIDPKQPEAYLNLADVYEAQGEPRKAKEILEQGLEATHNEEIEMEYSYYNFTYDELIKSFGRSTTGTYELSYEKVENYARVVPAQDVAGLVNYRIMDFDHDGENEVLALVIETQKSEVSDYDINVLQIQMYERGEEGFEKQAEYQPKQGLLGVSDYESDGVFLKTYEDEIYICGGLLTRAHMMADGSSFVSFVLTYDGEDFQFYTGEGEGMSGSSFESCKEDAEEMAEKLEAIGLPEAASHVNDYYMMSMTYEDDVDTMLFRVEGDNVGGNSSAFQKSKSLSDLGKIVLKYWIDTVQPDEDVEKIEASGDEQDSDSDKSSDEKDGFKLTTKMSQDEKDSLRAEIDALLAETEEVENKGGSMIEMKTDASESLEKWEAMMDKVYQAVASHLSDKKQEELAADQSAWLTKRDADAEAAAAEFEGGTMYGLEYVANKYTATQDRCYALLDWAETE